MTEFLGTVDAKLVAQWCIGAAAVAWVAWFLYVAWKAKP